MNSKCKSFHISHVYSLCKTFSLVPRSRSHVEVKYQGHILKEMVVMGGISVSLIQQSACLIPWIRLLPGTLVIWAISKPISSTGEKYK